MAKTTRESVPKTYANIVSEIKDISRPNTGYKMLIYGRSGTGKTTTACTFPKPLLLLGAEDGTKSVYDVPGVKFVRVKTPKELGELMFYIRKETPFKTVVLDSATSHQEQILRHLMVEAGLLEEDEDMPAQLGYGEIERETWNEYAMIMKTQLREFLELSETGTNAIILAQEKAFDTEQASDLILPSVMAAVSPSVAFWLNPECDYIGQALLREGTVSRKIKVKKNGKIVEKIKTEKANQYCLRIGPHPIYMTKFRKPKGGTLPELIVDPSYTKLENIMIGGVNAGSVT